MRRQTTPLASLLAIAAIAMVGCGSSTSSTASVSTQTPSTSTATTTTGSTAASGKVSANTATADELVAALDAAGVTSADRWAREIMEYRPYDTGDTTLASLRQELSKYNPSADQLAKIMSVLQP
jgi:ABC-type Fe3+-hydroxamate transport system substrate-binding protein